MFSPRVIAAQEALLHNRLGATIPGGKLRRSAPDICWQFRDELANAVNAKGEPTRALSSAESTFIIHEQLLCALDFRYWGERYATVAKESAESEPLTPLWASQELFLAHVGKLEEERRDQGHPDGLMFNVLKARQLGISTLSEVILAHRVTTQPSTRGLVAADVEDQSKYMLSMAELVVKHLPWWLKPQAATPMTQGRQITYQLGTSSSFLRSFWGKSSRGGMQDDQKERGNLGRGKTFNAFHLSELSTWERPKQIEDGFMPGVPRRPRTFGVFESTAKGRHDWWHGWWEKGEQGLSRCANVFIPWYIEPDKYWLPVPEGWEPLPTTKQHAEEVERDSPRWCLGQTHRLTPEQQYWYEATRRSYDAAETGLEFTSDGSRVATFYEEYPATPRDAFQHAGVSIFSEKVLERMKTYERPPVAICEVMPAKDIALLKEWERVEKKAREAAEAEA